MNFLNVLVKYFLKKKYIPNQICIKDNEVIH